MSKRASYQQPQGRSQSPPAKSPGKQSPPSKAPVSPPKNNQPAKNNQPPAKTQPASKPAAKETPRTVVKGSFDPSPWVKQGHAEETVL